MHENKTQKESNIPCVSLKNTPSDLRSHPKRRSYRCVPTVPGAGELSRHTWKEETRLTFLHSLLRLRRFQLQQICLQTNMILLQLSLDLNFNFRHPNSGCLHSQDIQWSSYFLFLVSKPIQT